MQEGLDRVFPCPRDEQLELHLGQAPRPRETLGKPDELPPDTDASMLGIRNEQPELAGIGIELHDADGPNNASAEPGDRNFSRAHCRAHLCLAYPVRAFQPETIFRDGVDPIDATAEVSDQVRVCRCLRRQELYRDVGGAWSHLRGDLS